MDVLSPNLTLNLLSAVLSPLSDRKKYGVCIMFSIAFLFLMGGYVLGCMGLYSYLLPEWGEAYSLFIVGGLNLALGAILVIVGWALRPKKAPPSLSISPLVEKAIKQVSSDQLFKKFLPSPSLKSLAMLFVLGLAASYLSASNEKKA